MVVVLAVVWLLRRMSRDPAPNYDGLLGATEELVQSLSEKLQVRMGEVSQEMEGLTEEVREKISNLVSRQKFFDQLASMEMQLLKLAPLRKIAMDTQAVRNNAFGTVVKPMEATWPLLQVHVGDVGRT